ncbi:transcriptional regulator NrdR [Candidatus Margulisiibacteriota bacterium]
MKCPYCSDTQIRVTESRSVDNDSAIRRRRECEVCKKRFTTYERVKELDLLVVKNDGRREPFDREKLKSGITKACEKRPISADTIDELLRVVEAPLREGTDKEITTSVIGARIMEELHKIDQVAYVRFASVYRQFKDVNEFLEEIKKII